MKDVIFGSSWQNLSSKPWSGARGPKLFPETDLGEGEGLTKPKGVNQLGQAWFVLICHILPHVSHLSCPHFDGNLDQVRTKLTEQVRFGWRSEAKTRTFQSLGKLYRDFNPQKEGSPCDKCIGHVTAREGACFSQNIEMDYTSEFWSHMAVDFWWFWLAGFNGNCWIYCADFGLKSGDWPGEHTTWVFPKGGHCRHKKETLHNMKARDNWKLSEVTPKRRHSKCLHKRWKVSIVSIDLPFFGQLISTATGYQANAEESSAVQGGSWETSKLTGHGFLICDSIFGNLFCTEKWWIIYHPWYLIVVMTGSWRDKNIEASDEWPLISKQGRQATSGRGLAESAVW